MARTATAQRMMKSLPDYYDGVPEIERSMQAFANEIDRIDAHIDTVITSMIPTFATDQVGLLSLWEQSFDLPVAREGATDLERQTALRVALRQQNAVAAADVIALLTLALGLEPQILRNTPSNLTDRIVVPFAPGTYLAGRTVELAADVWPAGRAVQVRFEDGSIVAVPRPPVHS